MGWQERQVDKEFRIKLDVFFFFDDDLIIFSKGKFLVQSKNTE